MLRHVVFFSLKHTSDLETVERGLWQLAEIPETLHFEVGRNTKRDGLSAEIDLVVYAEFADEQALMRYKMHPIYAKAIEIVRPLREIRMAADFTAVTKLEE
jgi:hypothetical protein